MHLNTASEHCWRRFRVTCANRRPALRSVASHFVALLPRTFGSPMPTPPPSAKGAHSGSSRSTSPSPLSSMQLSQISWTGMQAGFSLHSASSQFTAFAVTTQSPLAESHVLDCRHGSSGVQSRGLPATQVPAPSQVSASVHASPSEQDVPLGFAGCEQAPVCGLHVPASWHWSEAVQTTAAPGTHWPSASQRSPLSAPVPVQASPSEQEVPFGFAGLEQAPVCGVHVPASWHWSEAVQTTAAPGTHWPAALHWSPPPAAAPVQASPSEQEVPLGFAGLEQAPVCGV